MDFAAYQNLIEQYKHKTEDALVARFYDRAVKTGKLDANGMPVFKNVCYCEIRIKDNTTEVFDQPADDEKIKRFPVEYARYQLSKKQVENGTPLEQFAFLNLAETEACKYRGIFTVEALAEISDEHAKDLMLEKERKMAQSFINNSRKMKQTVDLASLENGYRQKIAALEKEIAILRKFNRGRRKK